MRTTITLDPDVVKLLEDEVDRARKPFEQVVNDAIRRGLAPRAPARVGVRYQVRPHVATFMPGLDRSRLNALADALEDDGVVDKVSCGMRTTGRGSE